MTENINTIQKTDKIALLLRGHVRESFNDKRLYNFIERLVFEYDVDIYVYTFNIKDAGRIYTDKEVDKKNITLNDVESYFNNLVRYVKKIVIDENGIAKKDNERMIHKVSKNKYLHMWSSILGVINLAKNSDIDYDYAINMRLDYFKLRDQFPEFQPKIDIRKLFYIDIFNDFVKKLDENKNKKIIFPHVNLSITNPKNIFQKKKLEKEDYLSYLNYEYSDFLHGIDNIFAGDLNYLYNVSSIMVNQIDDVMDFLEKIYDDLGKMCKKLGGKGAAHEAIFPLYIKNTSFAVANSFRLSSKLDKTSK